MADTYIMEVNNGGFDQYLLNTDGNYASDTLSFLEKVEPMEALFASIHLYL